MSKVIRIQGDGTFPIEVAGESFYQNNLIDICGPVKKHNAPSLFDDEYEDDQHTC